MDEYYGMGILSQLFKKVNRKQFYGTVPGEPGGMLGTIAPLVSRSPLARVERGPRLCRGCSSSSAQSSQEPLQGQSQHTSHSCSPPESQHYPPAGLIPHLFFIVLRSPSFLFISLQNVVLFIALAHLHLNSAK